MTDQIDMIYLKNFLVQNFDLYQKPSTENKIIYNKTIIKSKEKATLKMVN